MLHFEANARRINPGRELVRNQRRFAQANIISRLRPEAGHALITLPSLALMAGETLTVTLSRSSRRGRGTTAPEPAFPCTRVGD